jgi:hypothetical protein
MTSKPDPIPVIKFIPAAVLLGGLGWAGFIYIVFFTLPNVPTGWLFFLSLFLAVTGTALPGIAYLNIRFPGRIPAAQAVIVRQAAWVGVYVSALAWLQIGQIVTPAIALLLAGGLVVIEAFMRLRERGQWRG